MAFDSQPNDPRILLVEDNLALSEMLEELLLLQGYQVSVASHGNAALSALEQSRRPFDLIISDNAMKYVSGCELLQIVRKTPEWKHIPFIFLSATPPEDIECDIEKLGINGFIQKPFEVPYMLATIAQIISTSQEA